MREQQAWDSVEGEKLGIGNVIQPWLSIEGEEIREVG